MIFKHDDGTVVQITVAEFAELGELYGGNVEAEAVVEAVVEDKAEVTTEFKVGDKVKVIGKSILGRDEFIGKTAVIARIYGDGDIEIDEGGYLGSYNPSSLKLIEEEPEEVLSEDNVKEGELFEVVGAYGYRPFSTGTIVRMVAGVNDWHSSNFEDVLTGEQHHIPYDEIKRHTPEVLSQDNVKEGEYFVITDNSNGHRFATGEVIKAKGAHITQLKAEHLDGSDWWFLYYTDVRRATAEEIAEATKPKFEIGDVVKSGGLFAKIFDDFESSNEYHVGFFKNGSFGYLDEYEMRHATEEEKSHLQTLIGREKDEYKVGDLVELLDGFGSNFSGLEGCFFEIKAVGVKGVTIKRSNTTDEVLTEKLAWIIASNLKLITPVEWRHDFAGGV